MLSTSWHKPTQLAILKRICLALNGYELQSVGILYLVYLIRFDLFVLWKGLVMRKISFLGQSQKIEIDPINCQCGPSRTNVTTDSQGTKEQLGAYEAYIDFIHTPFPTKDEESLPVSSLWEAAVEPVVVHIMEYDM